VSRQYAAIVLAGGLSSRMKQFKPLLPLGETTVTDHIISTFLKVGADVFLVVGHRRHDIINGIRKRDNIIIFNPDYKQGMFSSVKAGISRLKHGHKAFFILPVDIPLVRIATIKRLMDIAGENTERIIYPVFKGKRGHPPLIPSGLAPAVLGWGESGGLKTALRSQEKLAVEVNVPDSNILFDIDTPDDYTALLQRYERYEVPDDEECDVILNDICRVHPDRIKHGFKVAKAAAAIGRALDTAGQEVDIEVVRKAAILHDIAKGQRKHDIAGGELLRELGFGKIANIVAVHSDLAGGNKRLPLEAKIVYLADKLIEGEKFVSLEERYRSSKRRFGVTPEIQAAIDERLRVAQGVKRDFEALLGRSIESIIAANREE
jgi:molybdenum cofactor cytidylyltransferase